MLEGGTGGRLCRAETRGENRAIETDKRQREMKGVIPETQHAQSQHHVLLVRALGPLEIARL